MNKVLLSGIFLATVSVAGVSPAAAPGNAASLPANMKLTYSVHYGTIPVGISTRTLSRQPNGTYRYTLRSSPTGVARMFTHIEWLEQGHFRVVDGQVLPLVYLKYRVGTDNPRREQATFEWDKTRIVYANGSSDTLPPGTQDGNSLIFELMLHPPTASDPGKIHITTGTKLIVYDYKYLRRETIDTALGRLKTLVIGWAEQTSGKSGSLFTAWLAIDRHNIPVKIVARQDGKTATMLIQSASGT